MKISDKYIDKIIDACENGKKFTFTIYDKKYRHEISPSGSGIKLCSIDPSQFNNKVELVIQEMGRIREEQKKANKEYIIKPKVMSEPKIIYGNVFERYGIKVIYDIDIWLSPDGGKCT